MKTLSTFFLALLGSVMILTACSEDEPEDDETTPSGRNDNAFRLEIPVAGSLQNPAFSPDGDAIVFTRFRNGYNLEPADIFIFYLDSKVIDTLVMDGTANVNLPGSCWNPVREAIVFSSSREPHDEIYMINDNGNPGDEIQLTSRDWFMAYEPSFSPDGSWIVFESHPLDVEDQGVIIKFNPDFRGSYIPLTDETDDCRQPNWSPSGNYIVYQKFENNLWDIWRMSNNGDNKLKVTTGDGDKTDASFSHDGNFIYYSADADLDFANIYRIPVYGGTPDRVTQNSGYDGAPSVSPDNSKLVFESCDGDPDESDGTAIWMLYLEK